MTAKLRGKGMLWMLVFCLGAGFLVPEMARASSEQTALALGPGSSLGSPFGELSSVRGAMDEAGESTLVFDAGPGSEDGLGPLGSRIELVTLSAAGVAQPASTIASAPQRLSSPVLAVAPDGRSSVAWFEEVSTGNQYIDRLLALRVRDVLPDGNALPTQTAWRPSSPFSGEQDGLTVATDAAGDEVVAWLRRAATASYRWEVVVSSRASNGGFTAPNVLTRNATEVAPAVAVSPDGVVTAVWPGADSQQILAAAWPAGSQPPAATVLDTYSRSGNLETFERFRDLRVQSSPSGAELATWLFGLPQQNRPEAVALRAAWQIAGRGFGPVQTVSSPGVEAREPAIALGTNGRALIVWSEITATGSGPVLNYATGEAGATFLTGTPIEAPTAERGAEPAAEWLPDETAVLLWKENHGTFAVRWTPGDGFPAPSLVAPGEASVELAAGGASDPVFVWDSYEYPFGPPTGQIRYVIADSTGGPPHPVVASRLEVQRHARLTREHGVAVVAHCVEACRLSVSARLIEQRSVGSTTTEPVGAFAPLVRTLAADRDATSILATTPATMRAYCHALRHHAIGIEAHLTARGLTSGATQTITQGEQISTRPCSR
jgi:hypothetical protein